MMYSALLLAATASIASAQITFDQGKFICPADKPNGAFCAGDSLSTNIIIRCTNGVGQPGNCNDNLAGYFPLGVQPSQCWQSSATSGIAACAKNCIVQGSSGTYNGTFTLPNCTPIVSSSSSYSASSTATYPPSSPTTYPPTTYPPTTTAGPTHGINGTTTVTSTGTETTICTTNGTTSASTRTFTTTYCPLVTTLSTSTYVQPSGSPIHSGNGTVPTGGPTTYATATPVGPTATPVGPSASATTTGPVLSNGAIANSGSAGAGLAVIGLFVAYFL